MNYHHKQMGWITIAIILPAIVILLAVAVFSPQYPQLLMTALIIFLPLSLFYCLTISVNNRELQFSFGIGLIRKTILIKNIESAVLVRNHWYHGWGIHYIGGRWLYNISGFDAVEMRLKNGKIIRLGTDEPEALLRAIRANAGMR